VNEIRTRAPGTAGASTVSTVGRGLALLATLLVALVAVNAVHARTAKPPIAGVTLDGKRLALADLRGKPVLINVWSSW
jgi:hypothetical protein